MTGSTSPSPSEKIQYVDIKQPDFAFIQEALSASRDAGRWTNFGPVSRRLEAEIGALLELPDDRAVVACASGTAALEALVGLYGFVENRPLRWVVSALTFECQRQGRLADSIVVDCGPDGFLDPDALAAIDRERYDGVIVTNLFGGAADIARWTELAARTGIRLLFDSATSFHSTYDGVPLGRFGDGEAFSFHHTKPLGVGEGGCIVVPAEHEATARSIINFGRYAEIDTGAYSMNGKLSDPAAAFILDRLRLADAVRATHRAQWTRIVDLASPLGFGIVGDPKPGLPSVAALSAGSAVPAAMLSTVPDLVVHKQYRPLVADAPVARSIHERLVCVPCHGGVAQLSDRRIREILHALVA